VITPEMRAEYESQGYCVMPGVFSGDEMETLRKSFISLEQRARTVTTSAEIEGSVFFVEADRIDRVCWCGACEPALLQAGRDPRILSIVRSLFETETCDHLINQAHFKLPGDGVNFPWHQDSQHRRYGTDLWTDVNGSGSFVQIVLAIDSATVENGCLHVFPGSQKQGHLDLYANSLDSLGFDESDAVAVELDVGDIVFFGPYLIHGSLENHSTQPRRALINGYSYPGANKREYPGVAAGAGSSLQL
jgi:ectoine hydroxylase-related dioxygenase (phytanoyl-CoA dioxygenase family)